MSTAAGLIIYRRSGEIDAIDQYSRRLHRELEATGMEAEYAAEGIDAALAARAQTPSWILLQYNPFAYGRGGVAPRLFRQAEQLRRTGAPLAVMVHEAWIDVVNARSCAISLFQRAQLLNLLRHADAVMTSTSSLARSLGAGAQHVPVGTNIVPVACTPSAARERLGLTRPLVVALFGGGNPSRALDYSEAAIAALARARGPEALTVANLGADAPPVHAPPGVDVRHPGAIAGDALSIWLRAADLVLLPFTDGLSTRRSTLMAALAHARPVLGLIGTRTEPELTQTLALTPVGDRTRYAEAAVELASDSERRQSLGAAGGRLYRERFDWPVVASRVSATLRSISAPPGADVTFVAHDVGGPGGMERHTEQLIGRLLDRGQRVTVVARTCRIEPRPGLRFRRVPTPRRPFTLAHPAFFMVASVMVARRRGSLVHSTGAVIANRADVITVHYCHSAAAARGTGSRASRSGSLYELNQRVGALIARAGESWCYRRGRVRVLCAVSRGVAEELELAFPQVSDVVRSIPNGVDSVRFAPDPGARTTFRGKLGLAPEAKLALFAGGDWERKGLGDAVGALAGAPAWHLAVAGAGDREPLETTARRDGTLPRLHFLDHLDEMAPVYAAADAFVFPTSYEAFPLVVLEAAASALPLLVTRVNGARELIRHGENGWFIDRDAADIAARLNDLSTDPEQGRSMAARARAAAAAYSWEAMGDAYASLYADLSGTPRHRGDRCGS
jgi:glycosyltransferase involved in cell wall biosynthesis